MQNWQAGMKANYDMEIFDEVLVGNTNGFMERLGMTMLAAAQLTCFQNFIYHSVVGPSRIFRNL